MNKLFALIVSLFALVAGFGVAHAADAKADLSGTWDAIVETSQGTGTPVLVLKQDGQKVTGQYKGQLGDTPITGTVNGSQFKLAFKTSGGVAIEYSGTSDGATMKGRAKLGDGEGSFTAKKRDK